MKVLFVVTKVDHPLKMNPFIFSQGESLAALGVQVDYLFLDGLGPTKYLKGIFQVKKQLRKEKYDLIHGHYNYNSWVATFQNNVPVVASFLGCDILKKRKGVKQLFNNYINNRVKKVASYFIYKTNQMAQTNVMQPYSVVPNGVDLEMFKLIDKSESRNQLGLDDNKRYVLFASDPDREEKNFSLANEVMQCLNRDDVQLLVVNNVTQEKLNLYYCASDLLIVTSLREGSINVVKEALSCNLPVVAVDVGDIKEHGEHVANVKVSSWNAKEFANDVDDMLAKKTKVESRGYIEQNLSVRFISKKIFSVYQKVAEKK